MCVLRLQMRYLLLSNIINNNRSVLKSYIFIICTNFEITGKRYLEKNKMFEHFMSKKI